MEKAVFSAVYLVKRCNCENNNTLKFVLTRTVDKRHYK